MLAHDGDGESAVAGVVGPADEGLYMLQVEAKARLVSGMGRVYMECVDTAGEWTAVAPGPGGVGIGDTGGQWQVVRTAVVCPAGTVHVRIDLRNSGSGEVAYRQVRIWRMGK